MSERHQEVSEVDEWLQLEGFEVVEETAGESFGDRVVVYQRGHVKVRFVSDRGEWFIGVTADTIDGWYDLDEWSACLDGGERPTEVAPFTVQAAALRERLGEIDDLVQSVRSRDASTCLSGMRSRWVRNRLGLGSEFLHRPPCP